MNSPDLSPVERSAELTDLFTRYAEELERWEAVYPLAPDRYTLKQLEIMRELVQTSAPRNGHSSSTPLTRTTADLPCGRSLSLPGSRHRRLHDGLMKPGTAHFPQRSGGAEAIGGAQPVLARRHRPSV